MDEGFGGVNGRLVHHLHSRRDDAGRNDPGHAIASLLGRTKPQQNRARGCRFVQNAHRDLGHHPEQAFRTGHQAKKVIGVGIKVFAAKFQNFAADKHKFDAQNIVGGQPVFQAMHPAGIFSHIAADRAGNLAGGVGGVIKSALIDRVGNAQIGDAGLGDDTAVVIVDFDNLVQFGKAQDNPVGQGQGAARQRGAGPTWHHVDLVLVAVFEDFGHLRGGFGQHHQEGRLPVGGQTVGFINPQFFGAFDHRLIIDNGAQRFGNSAAARDCFAVWLRHFQSGHRVSGLIFLNSFQPGIVAARQAGVRFANLETQHYKSRCLHASVLGPCEHYGCANPATHEHLPFFTINLAFRSKYRYHPFVHWIPGRAT